MDVPAAGDRPMFGKSSKLKREKMAPQVSAGINEPVEQAVGKPVISGDAAASVPVPVSLPAPSKKEDIGSPAVAAAKVVETAVTAAPAPAPEHPLTEAQKRLARLRAIQQKPAITAPKAIIGPANTTEEAAEATHERYEEQYDATLQENPYKLGPSDADLVFHPLTRKGAGPFLSDKFREFTLEAMTKSDIDKCKAMLAGPGAGKEIETFEYQKFVREYLRAATPYRGLLVYHGLGSGKTCSAIGAAEALFSQGKRNRKIIIMTPGSLRGNFQAQIQFCGFRHYKLENHWVRQGLLGQARERRSTPTAEDQAFSVLVETFAKETLHIPNEYIQRLKGAVDEELAAIWVPDYSKPANYASLSPKVQSAIRQQITAMLESNITFINYNGISGERLKYIACREPTFFDDATIIIDEFHNLANLMAGKVSKYVELKKNARKIPDYYEPVTTERWKPKWCDSLRTYERAILFYRLLTGARNSKIIALSGTPIINEPDQLSITMNILGGYIYVAEGHIEGNDEAARALLTDFVRKHPRLDSIFYTFSTTDTRTLYRITIFPEGYKKVFDGDAFRGLIEDVDEEYQRTIEDCFEDVKAFAMANKIRLHDDVQFLAKSRLPVSRDVFAESFINTLDRDNPRIISDAQTTLMKRMFGYVSYYKGATEGVMPKIERDEVIMVPLTGYALDYYIVKRTKEIQDTPKSSKGGDEDEKSVSNYRFNSRSACNFAFPTSIPRPFRKMDRARQKEAEEAADIGEIIAEGEASLEDMEADKAARQKVAAEEAAAVGAIASEAAEAGDAADADDLSQLGDEEGEGVEATEESQLESSADEENSNSALSELNEEASEEDLSDVESYDGSYVESGDEEGASEEEGDKELSNLEGGGEEEERAAKLARLRALSGKKQATVAAVPTIKAAAPPLPSIVEEVPAPAPLPTLKDAEAPAKPLSAIEQLRARATALKLPAVATKLPAVAAAPVPSPAPVDLSKLSTIERLRAIKAAKEAAVTEATETKVAPTIIEQLREKRLAAEAAKIVEERSRIAEQLESLVNAKVALKRAQRKLKDAPNSDEFKQLAEKSQATIDALDAQLKAYTNKELVNEVMIEQSKVIKQTVNRLKRALEKIQEGLAVNSTDAALLKRIDQLKASIQRREAFADEFTAYTQIQIRDVKERERALIAEMRGELPKVRLATSRTDIDATKIQVGEFESYDTALATALSKIRQNGRNYLVVGGEGSTDLANYSPKYAAIIRNIEALPGSSLIYSQFKSAEGLGIFGYALEANGYSLIEFTGSKENLAFTEATAATFAPGRATTTKRFMFFTGEGDLDSRKAIINIFNGNFGSLPPRIQEVMRRSGLTNNQKGEICRVIGITGAGAEGISLKCVRGVHIMEPYWNRVRTEQVKGRAVRICSHADLPPEERTVEIFTYCVKFGDTAEDRAKLEKAGSVKRSDMSTKIEGYTRTTDEVIMDIGARKELINNQFLNLLKRVAVDCTINIQQNDLKANECVNVAPGSIEEAAYDPDWKVDLEKGKGQRLEGEVATATATAAALPALQAARLPTTKTTAAVAAGPRITAETLIPLPGRSAAAAAAADTAGTVMQKTVQDMDYNLMEYEGVIYWLKPVIIRAESRYESAIIDPNRYTMHIYKRKDSKAPAIADPRTPASFMIELNPLKKGKAFRPVPMVGMGSAVTATTTQMPEDVAAAAAPAIADESSADSLLTESNSSALSPLNGSNSSAASSAASSTADASNLAESFQSESGPSNLADDEEA